MKNEPLFKETLDSLGVKSIYIDGFEPEQIFYQLENKLMSRYTSLEKQVNAEYSKFVKENASTASNKDLRSSGNEDIFCSSDDASVASSLGDSFASSEEHSASLQEDSHPSSEGEDSVGLEEDRHSQSGSEEIVGSSEESLHIEPELWNESSSGTEFVNLPACEVMKILRNSKNKHV